MPRNSDVSLLNNHHAFGNIYFHSTIAIPSLEFYQKFIVGDPWISVLQLFFYGCGVTFHALRQVVPNEWSEQLLDPHTHIFFFLQKLVTIRIIIIIGVRIIHCQCNPLLCTLICITIKYFQFRSSYPIYGVYRLLGERFEAMLSAAPLQASPWLEAFLLPFNLNVQCTFINSLLQLIKH